jgi:DNA-binding MarR family transcriptional regulator
VTRQSKQTLIAETLEAVRALQLAIDQVDDEVARRAGINRTDLRALDHLTREGPVSAGDLARLTGLTTGAMTLALDRLETAGLVRRVRQTDDRRRISVEATRKAERLTEQLYGDLGQLTRRRMEGLTAAQLRTVSGFLSAAREINEHHAERLREGGGRRVAVGRRGPRRTR